MPEAAPRLVRWGEPERERLNAMIDQDSLFYWKGPQTTSLIERFRQVCPLKHVMTCSSGTAALHIAVAAAGIAPGDEVITSPITDIGTVIGVLYQQAVPVFADLGRNTYNLDPDDVERRITPKTKAIIAVHLAGNPCDMDALKALADRHNLVLIEDCAQAWGAQVPRQADRHGRAHRLLLAAELQARHLRRRRRGGLERRAVRPAPAAVRRQGDRPARQERARSTPSPRTTA